MLSDLYAMGVVTCHNMLMLLGVSKDFSDEERDVVVPLIMKGLTIFSQAFFKYFLSIYALIDRF